MNRKQAPEAPADPAMRPPRALPLEAEVRANDLELDESKDAADDEAQPGTGENAPGFLKRPKP